MRATRATRKAEKAEYTEKLRAILKPGDTIYTVLRHRATSGMMRVIDTYIIQENRPRRLSYMVAKALGFTYNMKHEGVQANGAGMDMGFHIVNSLSTMLYGWNADGTYNHEGAYSLRHEWI